MNAKLSIKVSFGVVAIGLLGFLVWRLPPAKKPPGETALAPEKRETNVAPETRRRQEPQVSSPVAAPSDVLVRLSEHVNHFITNARPFGLDDPVRPGDIIFVRTNGNGKRVHIETKKYIYEFQGDKPRYFLSQDEGLDTRRDPSARSRWYQASARWTKEEALRETYAIMERLGIKATIGRIEYEATPIHVLTPTGETVEVAPFHTVWLHGTNDIGALQAQYRMSSSGPGRLVTFFSTMP